MANEINLSLTLTVQNPPGGPGYAASFRQNGQYTQNALGVNAEIVEVPTTPTVYSFANLATYGWMLLQSLDLVNYLSYGVQGQAIAAPTQNAPSTSTAGGTLPAATYYYKVTALTLGGETTTSAEQSITTTGSTSSNTVNWTSVAGATGYRIYRGTAAGAESLYYTAPAGSTSFVDTGAASTAGAPPASDTTSFYPFGKIEPGEVAVLRLYPGIVFMAAANSAPVELNYSLWND